MMVSLPQLCRYQVETERTGSRASQTQLCSRLSGQRFFQIIWALVQIHSTGIESRVLPLYSDGYVALQYQRGNLQ
jgi:hypothetical protein